MTPTLCDLRAVRRGSSLLWEPRALTALGVQPGEIRPLRALFALAGAWPDELPSCDGHVLVVTGMEGCLDALAPDEAERWLEEDMRDVLLGFQDAYGGAAGLVFWIPSGARRVRQQAAADAWDWRCGGAASGQMLPLGRALWGGAERDARPLVLADGATSGTSGRGADPAPVGLHHPRLS